MADFPLNRSAVYGESSAGSRSDGGVAVTAGSSNTYGSWTELITSTDMAYDGLWVYAVKNASASQAPRFQLAIGSAGNEEIFWEETRVAEYNGVADGYKAFIPMNIPSGSRISARIRSATGSITIGMLAQGWKGDGNGMAPGSLGGSEGATVLVDSGGSTDTKGAWSEFVASTSKDWHWIAMNVTNNNITSYSSNHDFLFDIGIGSTGNEEVIIGNLWGAINLDEKSTFYHVAFPVSIPEGSRVVVRSQASTSSTTLRRLQVSLVGLW